jgi:hypothetical protein
MWPLLIFAGAICLAVAYMGKEPMVAVFPALFIASAVALHYLT